MVFEADEAGTSRGRMTAYAFFVQVVSSISWKCKGYQPHYDTVPLIRLAETSTSVNIPRSLSIFKSSVASAPQGGRL